MSELKNQPRAAQAVMPQREKDTVQPHSRHTMLWELRLASCIPTLFLLPPKLQWIGEPVSITGLC